MPMQEIRPALLMLLVWTLVCGGLYPLVVTGLAHLVFPAQARGSLITDGRGRILGSTLIGQPFSDPGYLWPRPSATADFANNPLASGGSNRSPADPGYLAVLTERVERLRAGAGKEPVAADLVQASGSGLDPHISPRAAAVQVHRIAMARGMSDQQVAGIIARHLEGRQFGVLGAPRVNVLAVNLALDGLAP